MTENVKMSYGIRDYGAWSLVPYFFRLGVTLRFVAVIVFVDVNVNGILCGMDNKKLSVGFN